MKFEPKQISYEHLLRSYWRNIDPFDNAGQFCDRGESYKPVIFISGEKQKIDATRSLENAALELDQPINSIKVDINNSRRFWPAEDYHQDFAQNNSLKYQFYRFSCGRDARLAEVWGSRASTDGEWTSNNQHEKIK